MSPFKCLGVCYDCKMVINKNFNWLVRLNLIGIISLSGLFSLCTFGDTGVNREISSEHNPVEYGNALTQKEGVQRDVAQKGEEESRLRSPLLLVDKDKWKVVMSGFIEADLMTDSTRSLGEIPGNTKVDKRGTFAGDNGRTQFSVRNSRLGFAVLPPAQGDLQTKAYLEFDLFGYEATPNSTAPYSQSEASFFSSPTLRMRQAYFSGEENGWSFLAGQTWSLFGWQPYYLIAPVSISPVSGELFFRTPQFTVMKTVKMDGENQVQAAVSVSRPTQRDGQIPNVDAGIRFSSGWRKSGMTLGGTVGEVKAQPMSIGLSGTMRSFEAPLSAADTVDKNKIKGTAFAVDFALPILESSDRKSVGNTLTLQGEFTKGKGYGDQFLSWTGGIVTAPVGGTAVAGQPNLDGGLGGDTVAAKGSTFTLIDLQTYNLQLQYHLPGDMKTYVTVGYGQLWSSNVTLLADATYDRSATAYANVMHDFTQQIRGGVEYLNQYSYLGSSLLNIDHRGQVSLYFFF